MNLFRQSYAVLKLCMYVCTYVFTPFTAVKLDCMTRHNKMDFPIPKHRVLVKSGGFSSQLATHVGESIDGDPLWGSRFELVDPSAVIQTHIDFLESGAQIILTNTYQASVEGFMKHLKLSKEDSIQLMRKSVQLAKEAKDKYINMVEKAKGSLEPGLPLILGSVGPYGAMLHDGSEYNGSYSDQVSKDEIKNWHRTRIEALLAENVYGLAVETIPCQMEAEAVTELILSDYPNAKFWVSFQCKDELHLAHGEHFSNAAKSLWDIIKAANARDRIFGIGVNCVNPKFVVPLFKSLHKLLNHKDLPPLVVYSNRGETYDLENGKWVGGDKCVPLEAYVTEWKNLGAVVIGGCCRVYPADIVNIRKCIDTLDNKIFKSC